MRTKGQIESAVASLERINAAITGQIKREQDQRDELMCAFNSNSIMLCALKWTLGEDTITFSNVQAQTEKR